MKSVIVGVASVLALLRLWLLWGEPIRFGGAPVELVPVKVGLKWKHQAQFAGIYVAFEKGWYEDAGLDVTILEGGVDRPAVSAVLSGEAEFGVAGGDDLIVAVSKGQKIKAVAAIYQQSPRVLFSLAESGIREPRDFVGKTVGVKPGTGVDYIYFALLENEGIDRSRVREVEVGFDLTPLYRKEVDVWMGFEMNEPVETVNAGYEVNIIKPSDYGVDLYSDVLVASEELIDNNPELVGKFVEATLRGWEYALDNEDEATEITVGYSGNSFEFEKNFLKVSKPLILPNSGSVVWSMNFARWNQTYVLLRQGGVLEKSLDVSQVYNSKFIEY